MKLKLQSIPPNLVRAGIIGVMFLIIITLAVAILTPEPEEIPAVSQTIPQNRQENIIPIRGIHITFSQDLSEEQQKEVTFSTNPVAALSSSWISANTLQLTPIEDLNFAAEYVIEVFYKRKSIHSFSFKTLNTTPEQFAKDISEQAEGDREYAEAQAEWFRKNPWYLAFLSGELRTDYYTINYMSDTKKFRIWLTLGDNPTKAEMESAKSRALQDLKNTGADLNKYPHYFVGLYE